MKRIVFLLSLICLVIASPLGMSAEDNAEEKVEKKINPKEIIF